MKFGSSSDAEALIFTARFGTSADRCFGVASTLSASECDTDATHGCDRAPTLLELRLSASEETSAESGVKEAEAFLQSVLAAELIPRGETESMRLESRTP